MHSLVILEKARKEWLDASIYYELQRMGLGERFSNEIQKHLKLIQHTPEHFQKIKKEYRQITVPPFPFIILYKIDKTKRIVVVMSVFHTKKHPGRKYNKE